MATVSRDRCRHFPAATSGNSRADKLTTLKRAEDDADPRVPKHDDGEIPEARRVLEVAVRPPINRWAFAVRMPRVARISEASGVKGTILPPFPRLRELSKCTFRAFVGAEAVIIPSAHEPRHRVVDVGIGRHFWTDGGA